MKDKRAFTKGWGNLRVADTEAFTSDIMRALGIKPTAFFARRRGAVRHDYNDVATIERIFRKYGVLVNQVWGYEYEKKVDKKRKRDTSADSLG